MTIPNHDHPSLLLALKEGAKRLTILRKVTLPPDPPKYEIAPKLFPADAYGSVAKVNIYCENGIKVFGDEDATTHCFLGKE